MRSPVLAIALFFASLLSVEAIKGIVVDQSLIQTRWGDPIEGYEGPKLEPAELKGKIVIVEEFGIKTPACLNRLKDLARLSKKFRRDNAEVVIVAIHRQGDVPDAEIVKALQKARVEFIVRKDGYLPCSINSMPHAAIFQPDGALFWNGDSSERDFDRALDKVLKGERTKSAP